MVLRQQIIDRYASTGTVHSDLKI